MAQKNFADAMNQIVNGTNGLKSQINVKADKNSPALTGTPTAPTAGNDTDSTQIATTEFCQNLIRRLCGVDTKTIALLADLADALLNQPDFREAVVTVLDNKLSKTDAARTYATKAELDDVSVDTSNLAKLDAANTFTKQQTFNYMPVVTGSSDAIGYRVVCNRKVAGSRELQRVGFTMADTNNSAAFTLDSDNGAQVVYNSSVYTFKTDGIYLGDTKITN